MKYIPKADVLSYHSDWFRASFIWKTEKRNAMKPIIQLILAVALLGSTAVAKEPPNAPEPVSPVSSSAAAFVPAAPAASFTTVRFETHVVDKKFVSLAIVSTGLTFADSYTTLFARDNWLAHKQGVCNAEVESAYLYGTHPTVARTYAVASVKSAGSILAAYYLRKHHSKLWSLPVIANSVIGAQGVAQNMVNCN
jgi:hypothetical protein